MPKQIAPVIEDENKAEAIADTQVAEVVPEQTLTEFCQAFSATERRVELLGAFYSGELARGVVKDTDANFRSRFDEFVNKPV